MTTTQELIARLRDYEYEGCGVSVTQDAADALEALQAEVARLIAAYNMGTESYRALEKERNAALARERHTRETLNKFMEAGASPQLPTMDDALAAGDGTLHALIDKLQARVAELEAQTAQPSQARELSDWEIDALWHQQLSRPQIVQRRVIARAVIAAINAKEQS